MLVVISDLHLVDETAGYHNVPSSAYRLWLDHVMRLAEKSRARELAFLYLGDVFDLIRSEKWLDVPLADRPWGDAGINGRPNEVSAACIAKAAEIIEATAAATHEQLDILAGRGPRALVERLAGLDIPVRRLFVPGNHDRLYSVDAGLRRRIDDLLGVAPGGPAASDEGDLHRFLSRRYGVLARHGHEFDVWNFEGRMPEPGKPATYEIPDEVYLKVPIGDAITTEVVARLASEVRRRAVDAGLPPPLVDDMHERLQAVQDVRPLHATVHWVYFTAADLRERGAGSPTERAAAADLVDQTVRDLYADFMKVPFVGAWLEEHDRWRSPFDEADKLQALALLLRRFSLNSVGRLLEAVDNLGLLGPDEPQRKGASGERIGDAATPGVHYVVYGHTHRYAQYPLRTQDGHEQIYFNSGTWRPRVSRADSGHDFVQWKELTYLVFYDAEEDCTAEAPSGKKGLSFETWSGTMLKRSR